MKAKIFTLLIGFILFCTNNIIGQQWEWVSHLTGTEDIQVNSLTYDPIDDAIITISEFKGTMTLGTRMYTSVGSKDILIVKYSNAGDTIWTKQFGSTGNEVPKSILTDESGNIYATGSFSDGADLDGTVLNSYDGEDVFLLKIQSNGTLSWVKNVGWGSNIDRGGCVIVGDGGKIYLSGFFKDSIFFENDTLITGGFVDNYIVEYSSSGDYLGTVMHVAGTTNKSRINSISFAQDGGILATGILDNSITFSTYTLNSKGDRDIFILKVQTNGSVDWIRQVGSPSDDRGYTSDSDKFGNIYLTGYISGIAEIDSAGQGLFDGTPVSTNGGYDIFMAKYNPSGRLICAKNYGNVGPDLGQELVVDQNLLHVTGYFTGELVYNNDTIKSSGTGDEDIFIGVCDLSGTPIAATSVQGTSTDWGLAIRYDRKGNEYLGGYFKSSELTIGSDVLTMGGARDGFSAKYSWPFSITFTHKKNITCNEGGDGELTVTPYFGAYPYTYEWSPSVSIDSTATGLSAGTYQVIVTDFNSKKDTVSVELTAPTAITVTEVITDVSCFPGDGVANDGEIDITISGGTAPYITNWSRGTAQAEDVIELDTGTVFLTVTDDVGCTKLDTFLVGQPPKITFGGTIVTDISQPVPPGEWGAINLNISGGTLPYVDPVVWTPPGTYTQIAEDISDITVGDTYKATVTDDNGCIGDTSMLVNDNTLFIVFFEEEDITDVDCKGNSTGAATVSHSGGTGPYTYEWTDALAQSVGGDNPTLSGIPAGTYYCKVTDNSDGRFDQEPVTIEEPPNELLTSNDPTDLTCFEDNSGAIGIMSSGGTGTPAFNWTGPNGFTSNLQNISGLEAGNYQCIITDQNGCTSVEDITLTEPDAITLPYTKTDILCNGELTGQICVTPTGGNDPYTYLWDDPGAQTAACATNLEVGTYHVTVTDDNGCQKTSSDFIITEPTPITYSGIIQDVTCYGGSDGDVIITASGGTPTLTYEWWEGTTYITNTKNLTDQPAGTYTLKIIDGNACEETDDYTISEPTDISIDTEVPTDVTGCPGDANGTITIAASDGTPPLEYSIDDGATYQSSGSFPGLTAGDYQVKVKDANDCEKSGSLLTIDDPEGVEITLISLLNPSCSGMDDGSIVITAIGGVRPYEYSIDNGATWQTDSTFTGLTGGSYLVWIKDDNECMDEWDANPVNLVGPLSVVISSITGTNQCTIEIDATGGSTPYQYSIDGGLTFVDDNTFSLETLCSILGDTISNQDEFVIVVMDNDGCSATQTINVLSCLDLCSPAMIYDAITPNGDGFNDEWDLEGYRTKYPNMIVRIYSTWGNLVFTSAKGYPEFWDGTKDGKELPAGTYFYVIDRGDGSDPLSGTVNIIR